MNILYLDIFSGISGDMFLGALLDLGAEARKLERELKKLKLDGYHLHVTRRHKSGIEGIKLEVHLAGPHEHHHDHGHEHHPHPARGQDHGRNRTFAEIRQLITKSKLSPWVKKKSVAVFQRIAEAEGRIHGLPPERVHFHEVGAVDSIVDIVGACIALELLGKPRVLAAPVVEGTGWVECAHGRFPVPAPATLAILGARGIGVTQCEEPHELVTPTGAALLAEFAESFGPMQNLAAERIGFGLGTREHRSRPNVLRAVLGKSDKWQVTSDKKRGSAAVSRHASLATRHSLDWETDRIAVLETNLDDLNPEILGHFVEAVLAAGALDVFHTPVQMKKNRPGTLLTVLCAEADADRFSERILRETSAFGVRRTTAERRKLRREFTRVKTPWGEAVVKIGRLNGKVVQAAPEFESCKKLAVRAGIPLKQAYEAARKSFKINGVF
jgi:pyridinium-3,5-bisthiocarboxylic acid mononucleotide nickel chelatase